MNVREKAQEVANLSESSCRGAEAQVRYMEQVSPYAPEIARAYLAECEAHEQTREQLGAAKAFIVDLTRIFTSDIFGGAQSAAFEQIARKASAFLSIQRAETPHVGLLEKYQERYVAAVKVLRELEWAGTGVAADDRWADCPACQNEEKYGVHAEDCALWAIIKPEEDDSK